MLLTVCLTDGYLSEESASHFVTDNTTNCMEECPWQRWESFS